MNEIKKILIDRISDDINELCYRSITCKECPLKQTSYDDCIAVKLDDILNTINYN